MEIRVLNKSLLAIGIIEEFESMIWTDRYTSFGEFELYTNMSRGILPFVKRDYYLQIPESDRLMVIESINVRTNPETGDKIVVRGRSFESVLDRRIVLQQTLIDGSWQDAIERLLDENAIDSSQPQRNIPNLVFSASTDPVITALLLEAQYDSEGLYATIQYLCEKDSIGFKIALNSSNQHVFSLYAGVDRSYNQTERPYVVFSPRFDNIINTDFYHDKSLRKTYSLLFGDASAGTPHRIEAFPEPKAIYIPLSGLNRREMFIDAGHISKFYEGTTIELPIEDYIEQVREYGRKILRKNVAFTQFEGEADTTNSYVYGVDFSLGDIVQVEDDYGHEAQSRITEITFSENLNGKYTIPTFRNLEEEDEE